MADNTQLNAMTGGDDVRTKDRSGIKTQIVALDLNPAGSETLMAGTLPVSDGGGSLTVDVVSLPLPTGAATESTLSTLNGKLTACNTGAVVLAAGTALAGAVAAGLQTNQLLAGTTSLTPKFATISASSSGNTTVVAAVTSKKIRVLGFGFQAAAAVDVKFRSATAGDITGAMNAGGAGGGHAQGFSPVGHFETAAGEALQINLGSAVAVGGYVVYVEA